MRRGVQFRAQALGLEVDGNEGDGSWNIDGGAVKTLLFPELGVGMIHFEDLQRWCEGISVGKGVEAGAEHDVLANAEADAVG